MSNEQMKKLLEALDPMKAAEKNPVGPKFVGKWQGKDSAAKSKSKLVGANESFLQELEVVLQQPKAVVRRSLAEEYEEFKSTTNPPDVIKVDVPLLIRIMEYAREDAKTDMDLHNVAENLIKLSASGKTLSMDEYNSVIGKIDEYGGTGGYGAASQAPQGANTNLNDPAVQQAKADQLQIQKSTNNLAGTLNAQGAAAPVNKTKFSDVMTKLDTKPNTQLNAQELGQLGPLAAGATKVLQNPQTASQFKSLLSKADQADQAKQAQVKQAQQKPGANTSAAQQQANKNAQPAPGQAPQPNQQQQPGTTK